MDKIKYLLLILVGGAIMTGIQFTTAYGLTKNDQPTNPYKRCSECHNYHVIKNDKRAL